MTARDPGATLPRTEEEARRQGWQRCFVADEPRLSEAVQTYEELGFEVLLLPATEGDDECTECMLMAPERFKVIYTRGKQEGQSEGRG